MRMLKLLSGWISIVFVMFSFLCQPGSYGAIFFSLLAVGFGLYGFIYGMKLLLKRGHTNGDLE